MDFGSALSSIAIVAVVGVVFIAMFRAKQHRAELQAQVQAKLIERFQSAPELIDFLKSPTGQEFVSGVRVQQATVVTRRMLGSIRAAIFLAILGLGFLVLWPLTDEPGFIYPGVILLALGTGFFVSTVVSLKLSRAWGLDQPERLEPSGARDVR